MKKVLIIIDPQTDFVSGVMKNIDGEKVLDGIIEEMKKDEYSEIFITRDSHYELHYNEIIEGKKQPILHCDMYTNGWNFPNKFKTVLNDISDKTHIPEKNQFGYTYWDLDIPDEIDEIVICGFMGETNVISNALILRSMVPNVKITLLKHLTTGISENNLNDAFNVMKNCLIEVKE